MKNYDDHDEHVEAGSCPSIHAVSRLWCQMPQGHEGQHWATRGDQSQPDANRERTYWDDNESL